MSTSVLLEPDAKRYRQAGGIYTLHDGTGDDDQLILGLGSASAVAAAAAAGDPGVLLGNGRVVAFPSYADLRMQRCLILSASRAPQLGTNMIETFDPCSCLFRNVQLGVGVGNGVDAGTTVESMFLHADQGMLITRLSTDGMVIESKVRASRDVPQLLLHTLTFSPTRDRPDGFPFAHVVRTPPNLTGVTFGTDFVDGRTLFNGSGTAATADNTTSVGVAFATAYDVPPPSPGIPHSSLVLRRYDRLPVDAAGRSGGYMDLLLQGPLLAGPGNNKYTVHVASMLGTSDDFADPRRATTDLLASVVRTSPTAQDPFWFTALSLRHVGAWHDLWERNVRILPKEGASAEEQAGVTNGWLRHLRFALYHVYSSVDLTASRRFLSGASEPELHVVDLDGSVAAQAEIWLLPLLQLLLPKTLASLSIPSFRHHALQRAELLASAEGRRGARYPGRGEAAVPNVAAPTGATRLFTTAFAAVGVWNHFRVTKDQSWLRNYGYSVLTQVADYFVSRATVVDGQLFFMDGVRGLNAYAANSQHTMTNYFVRLAVKYAIEASYELYLNAKTEWLQLFYALPVEYETSFAARDVPVLLRDPLAVGGLLGVRPDSSGSIPLDAIGNYKADTGTPTPVLYDALIQLTPLYSREVFQTDGRSLSVAVQRSIRVGDDADPDTQGYYAAGTPLTMNRLLMAQLTAVAARQAPLDNGKDLVPSSGLGIGSPDATTGNPLVDGVNLTGSLYSPYGTGFEDRLYLRPQLFQGGTIPGTKRPLLQDPQCVGGVWGNLLPQDGTGRTHYDINLGALLVMTVLSGTCGVTIEGGVSDTRFWYEPLRIASVPYAPMPIAWDQVQLQVPEHPVRTINSRVREP